MKSSICITNRKQTASFSIVGLMLAIAPLWLMLGAAGTAVQAQTTSSPADWTQFLRDNMQRYNPYETVLSVNSVETRGLKLNWQNPTGNFYLSVSSPVVADGVVYYGSFDYSVAALTGHVYALNASTGVQLWSFATGGPVTSSPAVANGMLYFSSDGNLYALNASTGVKLWSYAAANIVDSPTVVNGVVYTICEPGPLLALNASTGVKLWSYSPESSGNTFGSSPAVANGVVYIGSVDSEGHVYALNASTGTLLWSNPIGSPVGSSPAVANGVVYVGSSSGVAYALNASTGAKLWSYATASKQSLYSAPAVANGVVYFEATNCCSCCQNNNSYLYALNADTGALLWAYPTSGQGSSSPAVANGVLYFTYDGILQSDGEGNDNNELYAVNATTGSLLWKYLSPVFIVSSPTVVDGVLYFRTGNSFPPPLPPGTPSGEIYAFGLGAGTADLFLRIRPTLTTVHQGDLLTYAFPVWNLGPGNAFHEVLTTQVPAGTTFDYIRISGTPGLGTCTHPLYQGTGQIVCHENSAMAPNTTWTVRLTVKVTAAAGTVITESAATLADTPDPNMANNSATVSIKVQ